MAFPLTSTQDVFTLTQREFLRLSIASYDVHIMPSIERRLRDIAVPHGHNHEEISSRTTFILYLMQQVNSLARTNEIVV
jgi:hypothetical protein